MRYAAGGRAAGRRRQPRARRRARGRGPAERAPGRRPGVVHRRPGDRTARHGAAAATVKKVALELGGKNPNIVFADADLDAALDNALTAVFLHSGQVCSAGARLIVEESIHDGFVDELVRARQADPAGRAFDDDAETGPLISAAHRDKVARLRRRRHRGGRGAAVRRGRRRTTGASPTATTSCPPSSTAATRTMSCVQDESFGPVLTVETLHAPRTRRSGWPTTPIYGLAGAVWSSDAGRAQRVAGGCGTARSGSTTTTPTFRRRSGADSSSPGSAASWGRPGCTSTSRPSTSTRTSTLRPSGWFAGHRPRRGRA